MTTQFGVLVDLERMHHHVTVRDAGDGSDAVYADCFDRDPLNCSYCDRPPEAPHVADDDMLALNGSHRFRVVMPVATYRISPSGFRQLLEREAVVA